MVLEGGLIGWNQCSLVAAVGVGHIKCRRRGTDAVPVFARKYSLLRDPSATFKSYDGRMDNKGYLFPGSAEVLV